MRGGEDRNKEANNREGKAERQEDLQQVPGDPSPRPGHGDLLRPAPQAASGLTQQHPADRQR
jgi:hypothetical protein